MTALDQAFIKAFAQQNAPPVPVVQRSATPMPKRAPVAPAEPRAEEKRPTAASLLAVLEKPPKKAPSPSKDETRPESTRPKPAEEAVGGPWAVSTEQWVVGPDQWTIGSDQWAVGDEPPVVDSRPSAACIEPCLASPEPKTPITEDVEPCSVRAKLYDEDRESPTNFAPHEDDAVAVAPPPAAPPSDDPACTIPLYPENSSTEQPFQPAWQVDHFTWPKVCRRLIARAAEELDRLADALSAANVQGQKVLGIAGYRRNEGATTLLLCAARRLAERGVKLALIDADLPRPRLAKRLGVQPQFGWDEIAVERGESLARAMVEASGNNLSLLPLREPPDGPKRATSDPSRLTRCVEILRDQYDMVLLDMGPLEDAGQIGGIANWAAAGAIDAVVLTHDQRITSEEELIKVEGQLAAAGIAAVGIVENFAAEN
jgi:Mrp family chromosome partitioning ATPase